MVAHIWNQVLHALYLTIRWHGQSVTHAWYLWCAACRDTKFHFLPLLICWSIWLTRNGIIFKDKLARWPYTVAKIITAYYEIHEDDHTTVGRVVTPKTIDRSIPWAFFDGTTQAQGSGGGNLFHITESHHFKIKMGLGL